MTTATPRRPAHSINDSHGYCGCTLGQENLPADVSYEANGDEITVVAVHINGAEIGAECFAAEQCQAWAAEIAADRATDLRLARDAAETELWLAVPA